MRRFVAAAGLALAAAAAQADEAQTRFGTLELVNGEVVQSLRSMRFAGRPVSGPDGEAPDLYYGSVLGVWPIGAADVALIGYGRGGSGPCMAQYLIVEVSAAGATATAPFGQCVGDVRDVRPTATGLDIDLQSVDPRLDHVAIVYAGGTVAETEVPLPDTPAPVPSGGPAVTRWAGVHAHTMIRDPGERQRFYAIMSKAKLFELMDRMFVGGSAAVTGDWLIAEGCMSHRCNLEAGAFAIEVATGRAEAVMFHTGRAPEVFGGEMDALHPVLQSVARTGRR